MVGGRGDCGDIGIDSVLGMEITGTREAFTKLIQERGISKRLGVKPSTVSTWKMYLRSGKSISLDKMEEMLLKAGASVIQEKVWEVKVKEDI